MAKYSQQHLEILSPDGSTGYGHCKSSTSKIQRTPIGFNSNFLHTSYVFAISMKEKSADNVMKIYLSNIFAHKEAV